MGRRRTLINDFGANWTTGRVSAKKNARMANEHDNNLNHHSISSSILCYQFNHEYSYNSNSYTRTIVSYCIISYILFSVFFYSIHWFHISFFFLYFLSNFFRTSFIFFSVFSACIKYYIQWFVANAIAKKKKKKKVWCGVSDVIAVKSNFASPSTKEKYGLAGLYFCSRFWKFMRRNAMKSRNLNDCKRSKR